MALIDNLKDINSQADLFNYICKLEEEIAAKDKIIDSQIITIADLHNEVAALRDAKRTNKTNFSKED
jgi:hypothetical protein